MGGSVIESLSLSRSRSYEAAWPDPGELDDADESSGDILFTSCGSDSMRESVCPCPPFPCEPCCTPVLERGEG